MKLCYSFRFWNVFRYQASVMMKGGPYSLSRHRK